MEEAEASSCLGALAALLAFEASVAFVDIRSYTEATYKGTLLEHKASTDNCSLYTLLLVIANEHIAAVVVEQTWRQLMLNS